MILSDATKKLFEHALGLDMANEMYKNSYADYRLSAENQQRVADGLVVEGDYIGHAMWWYHLTKKGIDLLMKQRREENERT